MSLYRTLQKAPPQVLLAAMIGGSPAMLAQTLTISRGVDDGAPGPTVYVEDRLGAELARRTGMKLNYRALPPLRGLVMTQEGAIDGNAGRILDAVQHYPNVVAVPTPVAEVYAVIYAMSADIANKTRADIAGMRIGTLRGVLLLAKYSRGMNTIEAGGIATVFDMLRDGRVDAVMVDYVNASAFLDKNPRPGIQLWPHVWAQEPVYLTLNRKHEALVPRINAALSQMKREGLIDRYREEAYVKYRIAPLPADLLAK